MAPAVLGYWPIRGLGQPIRLLLEYTGTEWEDKFYTCGPPPEYDRSSWLNEKFNLGLDFPNLPYLIDGDKKLTQTKAILKYIARKHNLLGNTEEEQIRVDLADCQNDDFRVGIVTLVYNPDFSEVKKADYLKTVPEKLEQFSKFLGNNPWFGGKNISYADFAIYEVFDQHRALDANVLKAFKNLDDFAARFENLDKISAFMKSPRFIKYPINFDTAKFGGANNKS